MRVSVSGYCSQNLVADGRVRYDLKVFFLVAMAKPYFVFPPQDLPSSRVRRAHSEGFFVYFIRDIYMPTLN